MLITDQDGEPVELDELDAAGLLSVAEGQRTRGRGVERDKLRTAAQWCTNHPATPATGVACWDPCGLPDILTGNETLGGETLGGGDSLGGDGTPAVAGFAAEPLAAALQISTLAAKKLMADALDLQHRLPQVWKQVQRIAVEPWKARKVAELTHPLSKAAAADVDTALAPVLASCSFAAIERAVAHAIATHHPELLAAKTARDKDSWDVTLSHGTPGEFTGTSWLQVTGDTLDLTALYDRLCAIAADLAATGDPDPLGARKAKAVGVLADQPVAGAEADLLTLADPAATSQDAPGTSTEDTSHGSDGAKRRTRRVGKRTHLFVHTTAKQLRDLMAGHPLTTARVEGLGNITGTTLQSWVRHSTATITPVIDRDRAPNNATDPEAPSRLDSTTTAQITAQIAAWADNPRLRLTPVLDLNRAWAVDGHEPPQAMREQVIQTYPHCVHPWCQAPARRADLDHIEPYVPLDEGGPPGQTTPDNLAPLCRRHHRCKTTGRWRYRRLPDGHHHWTAPHGREYLVTPTGTTELTPPQ